MRQVRYIPKIERLAGEIRASGYARKGQRELELHLGRALTRFESRAFHMAMDSRSAKDGHDGHQARYDSLADQGQYVTDAMVKRGHNPLVDRPSVDETHTDWLPPRGHTLRARGTDEACPAKFGGNANEDRMHHAMQGAIARATHNPNKHTTRADSDMSTGRNATPMHTFIPNSVLSATATGQRKIRGKTRHN